MENRYCYRLTWDEDGDEKVYVFYTMNDMTDFIRENLPLTNYNVKIFDVYQPESE